MVCGMRMQTNMIALWCAVLPFVVVHVSYFIAVSYGHVDWCNPYIDSCTSISATGRKFPESMVFKAGMICSGMLMLLFWWMNRRWLMLLHVPRPNLNRAMWWLGACAVLGLIIYVVALGEAGSAFARQRRIGTVLFFSFTYIGQLLLVAQLLGIRPYNVPLVLLRGMLALCVILLVTGILTVVLNAWDETYYSTVEDAFEWVLTLMLQGNFLLVWLMWRHAGVELVVNESTHGGYRQ